MRNGLCSFALGAGTPESPKSAKGTEPASERIKSEKLVYNEEEYL